jgi:prevent-host-death family protein
MEWSLQDAEKQFSEVVRKARIDGPQVVTLRGERAAVVLSAADYDALCAYRPTLIDNLLAGPA